MAWRSNRPDRKNGPVQVEVLPADELPDGVEGPIFKPEPGERDENGRFLPGSRTMQSKGGQATKATTKLGRRLSLGNPLEVKPEFAPYRNAAIAFKKQHVRYLADTVGGGICSSGPASIIASAAWQLALSRFMFDQIAVTGNLMLGQAASKLANDSRMGLMAAHELCAREAKTRADRGEMDAMSQEQAEFQKRLSKRGRKPKILSAPEFVIETEGEESND